MARQTFTAGQVLTAAQMTTLQDNSGLQHITTQTIGTTVSSVAVANVFSSTFDNYLIQIVGGVATNNDYLLLQLGATTTGYYWAGYYSDYGAANLVSQRGSNVASFRIGSCTTNSLFANANVFGPNLAKRTSYATSFAESITGGTGQNAGGFLNDATQYTGFTVLAAAGTLTGGTIRVYGYGNS
jgi:hypothetical protein